MLFSSGGGRRYCGQISLARQADFGGGWRQIPFGSNVRLPHFLSGARECRTDLAPLKGRTIQVGERG
jgi:hypothetical protein